MCQMYIVWILCYLARSFNQQLNSWDVSSIWNGDMNNMFSSADSFDKNNALWKNFKKELN